MSVLPYQISSSYQNYDYLFYFRPYLVYKSQLVSTLILFMCHGKELRSNMYFHQSLSSIFQTKAKPFIRRSIKNSLEFFFFFIWLFICCKTKLKIFFVCLKKYLCFLQNIHYLQKKNNFIRKKSFITKNFFTEKTFFTEKNINENVKKYISHFKNIFLHRKCLCYIQNINLS